MRKNIKFLAIMFAFAMQSVTMWSATTSMYPVSLSYQQGPLLGNNPKPSKAPAHYSIPLSVSFNAESHQLVIQDSSGEVYTYYILNENEEVVSQGILDFSSADNHIIDLWSNLSGIYTLVVVHDGHTFCGTFDID